METIHVGTIANIRNDREALDLSTLIGGKFEGRSFDVLFGFTMKASKELRIYVSHEDYLQLVQNYVAGLVVGLNYSRTYFSSNSNINLLVWNIT